MKGLRLMPGSWRTIGLADDGWTVEILDQTALPHQTVVRRIASSAAMAEAIGSMRVRGAPLIGAAGAYGLCLGLRADPTDDGLASAIHLLRATRPTAVNLDAALRRVAEAVSPLDPDARVGRAYEVTAGLCAEDAVQNHAIGEHGYALLRSLARPGHVLRVGTHCNAGWLATVAWGTALAPVYLAHDAGLPIEVWVSETRPRGQGALTAWELAQAGVKHTVITDNAAGWLLQRGLVDVYLVGTDRTTSTGDVGNKIGTYLKAVAAREHGVPFYACVPSASIDWALQSGADIPIEERDPDEVRVASGVTDRGDSDAVRVLPRETPVVNPAFDVTPGRLVTGLITERGVCAASADGLATLFPERSCR